MNLIFLYIMIICQFKVVYLQSFSQYYWSSWSEWPMACSSTCKVGQRCRIRKCEDVKGTVMESSKCGNPQDVKECQKCLSKGICPIDAGWSEWHSWNDCKVTNVDGCGVGSRDRIRICNNPKPKYEGMHCIGNSTETGECVVSCAEPGFEPGFLKDSINEHFKTLSHNIFLLSPGEPVTMDCYTDAYSKASITNKKLFVLWNFNGVPLRPLKELILQDMKSLQSKMNKAGAQASFQIPKGHIQYTGSKLTIDSVNPSDSGVFSCVLNYDYTDFTNTFFVLIVLGRYEYAKEFDLFTFNSNTDGLERVEHFDQAEIRWYLNRQLTFQGLLTNIENRFYTVYVNKTMEGHWECHLFADYHKTKHYIVNSFELKITYPRSILVKMSDEPILNFACLYFGCGILLTLIIFLTSFVVVKMRTKNWLNFDRKETIVEEEVENNRILLIVARKRAIKKTLELMVDAGQLDPNEAYGYTNEDEDNIS